MTAKTGHPRTSELASFVAAYFVAYALGMLLAGGGDSKFGGFWGTYELSLVVIVTPSSLAALVGYSVARWVKLGAGTDIRSPNHRFALAVAALSVLGAFATYEIGVRLADSDWQLFPWFCWILGGGPLILTLVARAVVQRRGAARDVAV